MKLTHNYVRTKQIILGMNSQTNTRKNFIWKKKASDNILP